MDGELISIEEARRRVLAALPGPLPAEPVAVAAALGRVLARDLAAASDVPHFANSAMDGYAVEPGPSGRVLRIVGESRAGHPAQVAVGPGEAVRISTGAAVPVGAGAVARVEDAEETDGFVRLGAQVRPEENVRAPGEDLRAGEVVLAAGTRLGPAELGVAVAAGAAELRCGRRPRVAVLCTGDELVAPGAPLAPGQIHNSNAVALAALAAGAGAEVTAGPPVADDRDVTERALSAALDGADVVVVSGGVSVGAHDHVKDALGALGVEQRFWGVALKPGKPTWFGARGGTLVFGLPGNPVSAMVTFLLFARPALAALQGATAGPERRTALLGEPIRRTRGRQQAVRVRLETVGGVLRAFPTGPQGSHVLSSMLGADALALVPAGEGSLAEGDEIEVEPV